MKKEKKNPLRIMWLILGFLAMGIGAVGVILPVLPTTPFLLLASFCLAMGIGTVSQVVYRDKTVQTASGEFCQEPGHDAEDKVQSADSGVLHADSGVSGHVKCIRQSIYYFSDFFQIYLFLYEDTHGPGRTDGSAGSERVRRRYIT